MKTISKDLWESVFLLLTERQAGHSDHDPAGRPGRIDAQQGGPGLVFPGPNSEGTTITAMKANRLGNSGRYRTERIPWTS